MYVSNTYIYIYTCICHTYSHTHLATHDTGWRRLIGCLKLQVIFRKRATKYRALWRKMTYEDKASYDSTPPYTNICFIKHRWRIYIYIYMYIYMYICIHNKYSHTYLAPDDTNKYFWSAAVYSLRSDLCCLFMSGFVRGKFCSYSIKSVLYSGKKSPVFYQKKCDWPKRALYPIKRALYSMKRALYSIKRALYSVKKIPLTNVNASKPYTLSKKPCILSKDSCILYCIKRALYSINRALYPNKRALNSKKKPYILLQEIPFTNCYDSKPCTLSQKPCILSKEPCILSKEPYILHQR